MAIVHLPRSLVTLFAEPPPRHLELPAASLGELVTMLDQRWPGMGDRLCEPGPRIRVHINVFVDGQRQKELSAPIDAESVVHIIPAVAGGDWPEFGRTLVRERDR
ncbi:hypothetical protein BH23CHL7_BH23CHL7_07980 [soil metagenome]